MLCRLGGLYFSFEGWSQQDSCAFVVARQTRPHAPGYDFYLSLQVGPLSPEEYMLLVGLPPPVDEWEDADPAPLPVRKLAALPNIRVSLDFDSFNVSEGLVW